MTYFILAIISSDNCIPVTENKRKSGFVDVISNNVAFWQVKTKTSLCSLLLILETPNDVWSVA